MNTLADLLTDIQAEMRDNPNQHCMSLEINAAGKCVELRLDTSHETYGEWIQGEGGDIGLIRCRATGRVAGITLPLMQDKLVVTHDGDFPVKVNEGFPQ